MRYVQYVNYVLTAQSCEMKSTIISKNKRLFGGMEDATLALVSMSPKKKREVIFGRGD